MKKEKMETYEPPKEEIVKAAVKAGKWGLISTLIAKTPKMVDRAKLIEVAITTAYYDGHEHGVAMETVYPRIDGM